MKKLLVAVLAVLAVVAVPAFAADYKCVKGKVEKGGSTKFTYKESTTEIVIEKGGSAKGKAVKRGAKWEVEIGGKVQASFANGTIEKGGAPWVNMSDTQRTWDCKVEVAATLWVLEARDAL